MDRLKKARLIGWVDICVDLKEEVEETVQCQDASLGKGWMNWSEQSVFGSWMLSDKYIQFVLMYIAICMH